jgi:hypothetical protein
LTGGEKAEAGRAKRLYPNCSKTRGGTSGFSEGRNDDSITETDGLGGGAGGGGERGEGS